MSEPLDKDDLSRLFAGLLFKLRVGFVWWRWQKQICVVITTGVADLKCWQANEDSSRRLLYRASEGNKLTY